MLLPRVPAPAPTPTLVPGAAPVGLQALEPGFQVVEQADFLAALGAVDVHGLAVVRVPHLSRRLPRTGSQEGKRFTFGTAVQFGAPSR